MAGENGIDAVALEEPVELSERMARLLLIRLSVNERRIRRLMIDDESKRGLAFGYLEGLRKPYLAERSR